MNMFYVYEHWRLDENVCFYVGKGKDSRGYSMLGRNKKHIAVQKILSEIGLQVEIRIVSHGMTEDSAFSLERERIAFWREKGAALANLTSGGQGMSGMTLSDEHKRKLSEFHTGRKHSEETRQKLRKKRKPWFISEEKRKKLRENMIGNKYRLGLKHSDERKKNISEVHKGKQHRLGHKASEETRKKMSESAKKAYTPELRKKRSEVSLKWNSTRTPEERKIWLGKNHSEDSKARMREAWVRRRECHTKV